MANGPSTFSSILPLRSWKPVSSVNPIYLIFMAIDNIAAFASPRRLGQRVGGDIGGIGTKFWRGCAINITNGRRENEHNLGYMNNEDEIKYDRIS